MSTPKFTAPETPVTREEVYYDAILRGLNGDSPAPVIPTPVWRMEEYLAAIAEAASSGGSGSLPSVTSSDNGKVLAVKDGAWAASEQGKKFLVTLTPTSPDYSGTMDKTVAEINAAYEAGQQIVFRIFASATFYYDIVATLSSFGASDDAKRFRGFGILNDNLVQIITPVGVENTYYGAYVYSLTPAS